MERYRLLPTAARDIESIRDFTVSEWGARQAGRYLTGLRQRLQQLATHPTLAPVAFINSSVRIALYREHRILYRPTEQGVEVGHVLHQASEFSQTLQRFAELQAK